MNCPTCGRPVPKQREVCSYCGSMVSRMEMAEGAAPPPAVAPGSKPEFARWEMHPQSPVFEPIGETKVAPKIAPPEASSEQNTAAYNPPPPSEPDEPAPRRSPPLIRVLVLLAFALFPFVNNLLRVFVFDRPTEQPPVFRGAVFCENILQGSPLHPKKSFSLQQDTRIVFFSDWTGSGERHALALNWVPPQGAARTTSMAVARSGIGRDGFSAWSFLRIGPGMPVGEWKTEVLVDGEVRATLSFEVQD
jgi:hypothetical protein